MHLSVPVVLLLGVLCTSQNTTELPEASTSNTTAEYYDDELALNDTLLETSTEVDVTPDATTSKAINASTVTPATTMAPTTTTPPPPVFPQRLLADWYCTCDLQVGVCDIDCCCDRDCSKFDLSAFPRCQNPASSNNEQCNTNGFLCIFKDNLPDRNWLHNPKTAFNLKDFDALASKYRKWTWSHPQMPPTRPNFEPVKRYLAGDHIWVTKDNATLEPFVLPLLGLNCVGDKSVRFLRELSVRCVVGRHHPLATGAAFINLRLLGNVSVPVANQSAPWLPVRRFLCLDDGFERCVESANATHANRVALHVRHNGTRGISAAKVLLWPAKHHDDQQHILLDVSVRFIWQGAVEAAPRRSGSPGYLPGSPILAGVLSGDRTAVASMGPFLLAAADARGSCGASGALLFGENAVRTCDLALNASDACPARTVAAALAPGGGVASVVAAFGDAAADAGLVDWMPVAVRERPGGGDACAAAPLSLSVDVLWAKVGAVHAPQNKLVGVAMAFGAAQPVSGAAAVRLTTTIGFHEVTTGLKGLFAPPPKYEIRLPNDFFYPLFGPAASDASPTSSLSHFVFSVIVLAACFVTLNLSS